MPNPRDIAAAALKSADRRLQQSRRDAAARGAADVPRAHVIGVYRERNGPNVVRLLQDVPPGWTVALWALDASVPELESVTVGVGSGSRFDLLNRILETRSRDEDQWLVVTDDDVLVRSGVPTFVAAARSAGLDLAQPAHRWSSFFGHRITRRQRRVVARLTTFVEIGPLFAVSPPWVPRIVPFPPMSGAAWGADFRWSLLREEGCRLGIVDQVELVHLAPVGHSYDVEEESARLHRVLDELHAPPGELLSRMLAVQQTLSVWRRNEPAPSWRTPTG